MGMKAHKNGTKDFREETYAEQAKSITAEINNLKAAIDYHIQYAPDDKKAYVKNKCRNQLYRVLGSVLDKGASEANG